MAAATVLSRKRRPDAPIDVAVADENDEPEDVVIVPAKRHRSRQSASANVARPTDGLRSNSNDADTLEDDEPVDQNALPNLEVGTIIRLELKNFMNHEHTLLKFHGSNVTFITGRNGSGCLNNMHRFIYYGLLCSLHTYICTSFRL